MAILNIISAVILLLTTDATILKSNNNIVSNNLPIYMIWFGSDIPPKYFSNLKRTADTNKTRDIILVYSRKHLPKDNRKNIDSIKTISVNDIKARVELVRNSDIENLWKIDAYDMELNKQDERIYNLLDQAFTTSLFSDKKSFRYCVASDLIRLPLINITGGIYFDMDAEITGEIGDFESKNGFNIFYYYKDDNTCDISSDPLIKTNRRNSDFDELMKKYFDKMNDFINQKSNLEVITDPVNHLYDYILRYYLKDYMTSHLLSEFFTQTKLIVQANLDKGRIKWEMKGQTSSKKVQSKIYKPMMSNYGIKLPPIVKLRIEEGDHYNTDYNDPEQLKKIGLADPFSN